MKERGQVKMGIRGKKAQVTLFVIMAIVIVVGASLLFILRSDGASSDVPKGMVDVKVFVDSCIESSIEEYTYIIGEGGGYIFAPLALSDQDGITYYYLNDEIYFPTKKEIEIRLSNAIRADVLLCVKNFRLFPSKEVEAGKLEVNVEILENKVLYDIIYPLNVKVGDDISTFSNFGQHSVDVRLGLIHSVIEELIRQGAFSSEGICLSCFAEVAHENELSIDFLEGGNEGSIFIFEDELRSVVEMDSEVYEFGDEFLEGVKEDSGGKVFRYMFASD